MKIRQKHTRPVWVNHPCALLACAVLGLATRTSLATSLRIVSYNIDDADQGNDNNITASYAGLPSVLQAIGLHQIAGNSQMIDVLGVEELNPTTLPALVAALNGIYGAGTYDYDRTPDPVTNGGGDGLIFNTHTVQIIGATAVGTDSTSGAARAPMRYEIQPVGYGTSASFYTYVSHFKASTGSSNIARRNVEATTIRTDADALGPGAHIIYSGDFNPTSGSSEPAYATLTAVGNGRAYDPTAANFVSTYAQGSSAWKYLYTESTTGLGSRDDFQLVTSAVLNQPGLQLAPDNSNSNYPYAYQVFGNNGTTPLNGATNAAGNSSLNDLSNPGAILNDMMEPYSGNGKQFVGSDHLPVVADYNLVGVAQVPIYWLGGTSTWSTAAKWSTTVVPDNSSIKLQIDSGNGSGSVVTLDQNTVIQDLTLDANDTLNINPGWMLMINGPTNSTLTGELNNGGTLAVAGGTTRLLASGTHTGVFIISNGAALDFHGGTQTFTSDASFSGGGQVGFSGAAATAGRMILGSNGTGDNLTVTQSVASVAVTGDLYVAAAAGGSAAYVLSGGSFSAANAYVGGTSTLAGGTGAVTISGGSATIAGTLKIWNAASSVVLSSGALTAGTLNMTAGTLTQTGGSFVATSLVQSGGALTLGGGQNAYTFSSVTISGGSTTVAADGAMVLVTSGLTLTGTGMLNLSNNDMIIHASTPAAFRTALASGYNSGAFNAPGISSTYAPAHPSQGFGAISGADYLIFGPGHLFDGLTVAPNDVLVKYTYLGDATLDGTINLDDYLRIDRGYAEGLTGWVNGDFNYDGTVDFHDYALIDAAFNVLSGSLASGEISAHASAFGASYLAALAQDELPVPEPATLLLLAGAMPLLLGQRSKR